MMLYITIVVLAYLLTVATASSYSLNVSYFGPGQVSIGARTQTTCACNVSRDPFSWVVTNTVFLFGGMLDGKLMQDVWQVNPASEPPTFSLTEYDLGVSLVQPMMDVLANGLVLLYGGDDTSSTVYSGLGGFGFSVVTSAAGWAPRALNYTQAHTIIPYTNTVVVSSGVSVKGVDNMTWICTDGLGLTWVPTGIAPVIVVSAALIGINPSHNPMNNGTILSLGGIVVKGGSFGESSNIVMRSTDLGVTWSSRYAKWSPRYGQNAVVDLQDVVYMINGITSDGLTDPGVWYSVDVGLTWMLIPVDPTSAAPVRVFHGCTVFFEDPTVILTLGGALGNGESSGFVNAWILNETDSRNTNQMVMQQ